MRYALTLILFLSFPALADELEHPQQWQYHESLEVPALIPEDRCIRAIYLDDSLKEERGAEYWEEWDPPITDTMARWLDTNRRKHRLYLQFCDQLDI